MADCKEIPIEKIFNLIRNGEKKGIGLLYEIYYKKMFGIAFSVCRNQSYSQDIVHNVIYKLLNLDSCKLPSQYELTWLYRVVKNEAISFIRKESKTISLNAFAELNIPTKHIEDYVDMENFLNMIKPLKKEQKIVVTLKVLGEYSHKEIAIILNKPIGTIQWLYNTSIKTLRVTLTSMLAIVIALIAGIVTRAILHFQDYLGPPEKPGQVPHAPFDIPLVVMAAFALIILFVFIITYKKSDKIPIKVRKKSFFRTKEI